MLVLCVFDICPILDSGCDAAPRAPKDWGGQGPGADESLQQQHNKFGRQDLVLVFVACDFVANMLNRIAVRASPMHSDRTQDYREKNLAAFKEGSTPVMVATDVARRGLDVKGVSALINYGLAINTEDYVHRIGRTGRAGMKLHLHHQVRGGHLEDDGYRGGDAEDWSVRPPGDPADG